MVAATTSASTPLSLSSSSVVIGSKPSSKCAVFPVLPPRPVQSPRFHRAARIASYSCRKSPRSLVAMAAGEAQTTEVVEAPSEVVESSPPTPPPPPPAEESETPEIVKTIQEKWDKVEDKYAVIVLLATGVVVLWGSTGLVYAIDRLPLIPGVLELVGIGYSVWFAYKNLVFKPARDALLGKIGDTYKEIIGSS